MCHFSRVAIGRRGVSGEKVSVFFDEKLRARRECSANEQNKKKPVTPFEGATSASTPQYRWGFSHEQFGVQPFNPNKLVS
jgi:hypothetical protein